MGKLQDKIALVTGGTTGIGLATAKRFHAEGAKVYVTGSNPTTLDRARSELHGVAEVIASDAADANAVEQLFKQLPPLDVLFINAGVVQSAPLSEMSEDVFDRLIRVNLKGPWLALKAAASRMRRGGSIVLNGSISGHIGTPGSGAYAASKAGVVALARVAAAELAPAAIRVNVISPGPTDSGIIEKAYGLAQAEATHAALTAQIPLGRLGKSDEIAAAALFLASDEASFMTGEEIVVDGGMTRV